MGHGFKDGISQPLPSENDQLVWIQPGSGNPDWAVGGTYHVVRFIRMLVEFWDRVDIHEQETMFGRGRDSGGPTGWRGRVRRAQLRGRPEGRRHPAHRPGGYFLALPGVRDAGDWLGRTLLAP